MVKKEQDPARAGSCSHTVTDHTVSLRAWACTRRDAPASPALEPPSRPSFVPMAVGLTPVLTLPPSSLLLRDSLKELECLGC